MQKKNLEKLSHEYDSYIKTVLKNYKRDHIRKNGSKWENECYLDDLSFSRRENLMRSEDKPDDEGIYVVDGKVFTEKMIRKAVNLLPEKKSVVITLHYYDDISDTRIAEMLGITRKGVSRRRREALEMLKKRFEGVEDVTEE